MDIGHFAQRNDKVLLFVVAALAALGVYAYVTTPQSIFPTMTFSRVDVVADAGQLPPEQVRVAVTQPLERAFQTLPNVTQVVATSAQGSSEVVVNFDPKTDTHVDLNLVDQAIAQTRSVLPNGINPQANIVNPNQEPVLSYAVTSSTLSGALLREMAERTFIPAFAGVPGLARVAVAGGRTREFHIRLDPAALAAYNLSPTQVEQALATANDVRAVGLADHFYQRYVLIVDASLRDAASIGDVTVPLQNGSSVTVNSLADVALGVAPATNAAAFGGDSAVILNAYGLPGADVVQMAHVFQARIADLERHLPRGTTLHKYWDQTTLIIDSQRALRDAIILGAALAILVILIFLRNLRMTLVAAAVIPLAMAITVFVMSRAGQTLNLMSVGGLAVAVGLIIDDAIVVIENIARNMRERPGLHLASVVRLSMHQIAGAMVASTATTVVVFLPLALLSGIPGFFFRALAFTLAAALIVSLGLALFVAPTLASRLLHSAPHPKEEQHFIQRLLDRYEPLLRWSLGHRKTVFIGAGVVLAVTVALLAMLPSDFLPKLDEGQFEIQYAMPVGTTLQATDASARHLEKIVLQNRAVVSEGRLTGIDSNGFSPMPPNRGLIRVSLVGSNHRPPYDVVTEELRSQMTAAVPAAKLDFHQILEDIINDLSGTPRPIELTISGVNQARLIAAANQITNKLSSIPGVVDPFSGITYDDPVLRISPFGARLAALGVTSTDVANSLNARTQGTVATSVPGSINLIPVRIAVNGQDSGFDALSSNPVVGTQGTSTLGALARVRREPLSSDVTEINGQRVIRVTASISGASLSAVINNIKDVLRTTALAPGYSVAIGGQYKAQQSSFAEFMAVILIAIVLVFTVMLGAFNSYRLPAVILTAIPLALIGVALGLFITRTPLNVSSFMGLLLLVGIVVKNGILLVDVANKRRHAGDDVTQALVVAGRTRLRPIVMTTLAAIAGLLPLAIGLGSGAEMERPLAIAVIGGLSTATIFTLVLIPVLYAGFVGGHDIRREEAA